MTAGRAVFAFAGIVHPLANEYPLLAADELDAMTDDIAANGLRDPIVLDQDGQLIDGRNRLAACQAAGIEPEFVTIDFADDDAIAAYILSVNVEKRSLSAGQRAMFRACDLARQGKRVNGRWKRGSLDNGRMSDSEGWLQQMKKAGRVLDVAARAAARGDDFADWATLPDRVKAGDIPLSRAHDLAGRYDALVAELEANEAMLAALAQAPLASAVSQLRAWADESARYLPLPILDVAPEPRTLTHAAAVADHLIAAATQIRTYIQEHS